MIVQLEVKDTQSEFFLTLLSQLKSTIKDFKILQPTKHNVVQNDFNDSYFEITDSNGIHHKIPDWKDGEFKRLGLESFFQNEEKITAEELFDV